VKRFRRQTLEDIMRTEKPQPRSDFMQTLASELRERHGRRLAPLRVGLAAAVTGVLLVGLASFGGLGYAASGTSQAVHAVKQLVAPTKANSTIRQNPASDQYRPGCGFGDKNHIHTGPPGRPPGFCSMVPRRNG
jgi:hypothetical protein